MLAKNAESSLAGPGCRLIRQPRQPINLETEFAKASQGPADEFIVREGGRIWACPFMVSELQLVIEVECVPKK